MPSLKGEFEHLCAAGKMAQESRALVQALLALFELLMAVFMEKHTPENSRKSSRPSSQMEKADETATQPGTQAKGRDHPQGRTRHTRTLETVERSPVSTCAGCFRTRRYAEAYCRISSYLQPMADQGYSPLVAIQMALSGEIYAQTGE